MDKRKTGRASLGDIARAAKISTVAASYALNNRPGVSAATRARVQRIAKKLGYVPDPRLASLMTKMHKARSSELESIVWLNSEKEEDAWEKYSYLAPYLEGAKERCREMGYRLEQIWTRQPSMTMRRLSQILYQRNVEGVILTYPAKHIRLKWENLACVVLGGALLAPRLHRVMTDMNFNFNLALKSLRREGYNRIGLCIEADVDALGSHVLRSAAHYFTSTTPKANRVPPLFFRLDALGPIKTQELAVAWLRRHRPDVIVVSGSYWVDWVKSAGLRVPEDTGVVHLSKDGDVSKWAGIHTYKRELGAMAAEWVISRVQNRRFGIPKVSFDTLVRGSWHEGGTLLTPRPKVR